MTGRIVLVLVLMAFAAVVFIASCTEPPPGEIIGKVTKDGRPYGCVVVAIKDGQEVSKGQTSDGVYSIDNIPPGHYTVQCQKSDGTVLGEQECDVDPEGSTNLNFILEVG
jgi:Flp pilus assembly protein CpaB